ncbi:MAG: FecR domain-containing protein [Treponema sp.]|nr:FecR domain-containing protein [Treponema sp.]
MKKKTKFRLRNDLAVPFWISVVICLIAASVCFLFFYRSFFRALEKMDEEPIAEITFKYKTAQRKFLDRVVWDRLRQKSPVYNGDTIHTAALSEATVWFDDGTTLELAENTMAQVFRHEDGTFGAEVEDGFAVVDSSSGTSDFILTSSGTLLRVTSGTKITMQTESGTVNVIVQDGKIMLEDGTVFDGGKSVSLDQGGIKEDGFFALSPYYNEKIIYYDDGLCNVHFKWQGGKSLENLTLRISEDKSFSSIVQEIQCGGMTETYVPLTKGIYYWSLSSGENAESSCSGKIQVVQSLKPELITPVQDYTYQYRKSNPSVRFIWTESKSATAYNFVVSKSPDMKNPVLEQRSSSSSIILSTLSEGTYYWQVTPYYTANKIGLTNPSEIGSFNIVKRGVLGAPVLYTPVNGEFVNKQQERLHLSWRMENEPATYKVTLSQNQNLSSPVFIRETRENFVTLSKEDVLNLKDGQYYWSVTQIDGEGNVSPAAKVRSFYAVDGKVEQRTIFPSEGYEIWRPLVADVSFTWKSNLNFEQHIQIAGDPDFKNIVFDSEINGNSYSGVNLAQGTYYWRLASVGEDFSTATNPKKFFVVGELEAPVLLDPTAAKRAVVRPGERYSFHWQAQEGADYYRIKLYKDNGGILLLDENFIDGTSFPISMEGYEEGAYRWEVQSYKYETEHSSRRSSSLGTATFSLRKIRPATLVYPIDGVVIDGWEAIENPPVFTWSSGESFSKADIVLSKRSGLSAGTKVLRQTGYSYKSAPLSAGTYEWTVNATTLDNLDISSARPAYFTVSEIPPFAQPGDARTEGGNMFDADYLRKTPYIIFKWQPVQRAEDYILEIYKEDKLVRKEILSGNSTTEFKLEELASLSRGDFKWTVRGVRMTDDKTEILIDGYKSENTFTIDYSLNSTGGKRKNMGDLYAQ